jgi:hypothetical protein
MQHITRHYHQGEAEKRPWPAHCQLTDLGFPAQVPDEVSAADESGRPNASGREVQDRKPRPPDRAYAKRQRGEIAHAIHKAEGQDEGGPPAVYPTECAVEASAPPWITGDDAVTEKASDQEPCLISGEGADPRGHTKEPRVHKALRRENTAEKHKGFAF